MPQPRVIGDYLAVLAAQLPAPIVEELADGLADTYQSYLRQGMAPGPAGESAVAEFGDPHVIVAEFARVSPARRGARRLLLTGPVVGGCWAAVLITGRPRSAADSVTVHSPGSAKSAGRHTDQDPAISPACSSRRSAG